MNRCLHRSLAIALFVVANTLLPAPSALAQQAWRNLPASASVGVLQVTSPPLVELDGKPEQLSPGARIRNAGNTIVMSASLVGLLVPVRYLRDAQGQLHEVWILSPQEAPPSTSSATLDGQRQ